MIKLLTLEERKIIMDKVSRFYADNFLKKQIEKSENTQEAIKVVKHWFNGGWSSKEERVHREIKGIYVERYKGKEVKETISWEEFVEYIRADSEQLTLF